jgi:hypothetical protein
MSVAPAKLRRAGRVVQVMISIGERTEPPPSQMTCVVGVYFSRCASRDMVPLDLDVLEDYITSWFGAIFRIIIFGFPMSMISSRSARGSDNEISTTRAIASRVKSSTTHCVLIWRPSLKAPETISKLQRSFGPSGSNIGLRVPMSR